MMLTAEFFDRPTLEVAPELLGATLFVGSKEGMCSGRIIEVEAYLGSRDLASHAAGGPTPRSSVMFGPPGRTYIYLIYGIHHCLNFITEPKGTPGAVLIRALDPLTGLDLMTTRRKTLKTNQLCNGPGKLCQALGLDLSWNNLPLTNNPPKNIYLTSPPTKPHFHQTPRIGINKSKNLPYRFLLSTSNK
jgi:DNA-3-methyladenine glycosylase